MADANSRSKLHQIHSNPLLLGSGWGPRSDSHCRPLGVSMTLLGRLRDSLHECYDWPDQGIVHIRQVVREQGHGSLQIPESQVNIHDDFRLVVFLFALLLSRCTQSRLRQFTLSWNPIQLRITIGSERSRYRIRYFTKDRVERQVIVRVAWKLDVKHCINFTGRNPGDGAIHRSGISKVVDVDTVDAETRLNTPKCEARIRGSQDKIPHHPRPIPIPEIPLCCPSNTLRSVQAE